MVACPFLMGARSWLATYRVWHRWIRIVSSSVYSGTTTIQVNVVQMTSSRRSRRNHICQVGAACYLWSAFMLEHRTVGRNERTTCVAVQQANLWHATSRGIQLGLRFGTFWNSSTTMESRPCSIFPPTFGLSALFDDKIGDAEDWCTGLVSTCN